MTYEDRDIDSYHGLDGLHDREEDRKRTSRIVKIITKHAVLNRLQTLGEPYNKIKETKR